MASGGRNSNDELLAAALAGGKSIVDAAAASGMSERTAHRRNAEATFKARVAELRDQMVTAAAGKLAANMGKAADTLVELLTHTDPNVRRHAAAKILEVGLRVIELEDLQRRMAEIESRLAPARNPG